MKRLLRLLPLVCLSAWCLSAASGAETNHNFARWEKEIAAYERADQTNPPPKGEHVNPEAAIGHYRRRTK